MIKKSKIYYFCNINNASTFIYKNSSVEKDRFIVAKFIFIPIHQNFLLFVPCVACGIVYLDKVCLVPVCKYEIPNYMNISPLNWQYQSQKEISDREYVLSILVDIEPQFSEWKGVCTDISVKYVRTYSFITSTLFIFRENCYSEGLTMSLK